MTDEEINLLEIGKRITERRKKLGLTQEALAEKGDGFVKTMWCGSPECEAKMKELCGITSRCIPFDQTPVGDKCICCGKPANTVLYWGKAY